MRRVILALTLFIVLVLVVAPAFAKPQKDLQKVTWKGSGVAENGAFVKFSGSAHQSAITGKWSGSGTFVDKGSKLEVRWKVGDILPPYSQIGDSFEIVGEGDVTIAGVRYEGCEINMFVDRTIPELKTIITAPGGLAWTRTYTVTGDNFHGLIKVR